MAISTETWHIIAQVCLWILVLNIFGFATYLSYHWNRQIKDSGKIPVFRVKSTLCCCFCTIFTLCYPIDDKIPLVRQKHRPFPSWSATFSVLIPTAFFLLCHATVSSEFRYFQANAAWWFAALYLALAIGVIFFTYGRWRRGKKASAWMIISLFLLLSVLNGLYYGDRYYWRYLRPYYDYQSLGIYVNVDPSAERGQTFMDAGEVYFKEGTSVAKGNAIALKNGDIYCVAPIVRQPLETMGGSAEVEQKGTFRRPDSGTVDFWAVGTNCCMTNGEAFNCGGVDNAMARSGLRLVRDDQRPFYKLAVDEWAAEYEVPAKHPLFFYWTQDPVKDVEGYYLTATRKYWGSVLLWFAFNLVGAVFLHAMSLKYGT